MSGKKKTDKRKMIIAIVAVFMVIAMIVPTVLSFIW